VYLLVEWEGRAKIARRWDPRNPVEGPPVAA
jgi:hypothetical protein